MREKTKALIILASGFEEIEAVTVIDVLRRGGVEVIVSGAGQGDWVTGSHGVKVAVDNSLSGLSAERFDLLILPGGMPGTRNLAGSQEVQSAVDKANSAGVLIGAICAAPVVLAEARVLRGRRVTCYPGFENELKGAVYTGDKVVVDGNIITADGPGSAIEFALTLLQETGLSKEAGQVRSGMLV